MPRLIMPVMQGGRWSALLGPLFALALGTAFAQEASDPTRFRPTALALYKRVIAVHPRTEYGMRFLKVRAVSPQVKRIILSSEIWSYDANPVLVVELDYFPEPNDETHCSVRMRDRYARGFPSKTTVECEGPDAHALKAKFDDTTFLFPFYADTITRLKKVLIGSAPRSRPAHRRKR